jgi:hypothetical protein
MLKLIGLKHALCKPEIKSRFSRRAKAVKGAGSNNGKMERAMGFGHARCGPPGPELLTGFDCLQPLQGALDCLQRPHQV